MTSHFSVKVAVFGLWKDKLHFGMGFLFRTFSFQFSLSSENSQMSTNRDRPCVSVLPKHFLCTYCIFLICGTYWQRLRNLEKKNTHLPPQAILLHTFKPLLSTPPLQIHPSISVHQGFILGTKPKIGLLPKSKLKLGFNSGGIDTSLSLKQSRKAVGLLLHCIFSYTCFNNSFSDWSP